MYVKRVVLENIKGFRDLDFRFDRPGERYEGWTVITGDNASGKTALLKAIALAIVGPDVARALQPSLRGWIRRGAAKASIAVEIVPHEQDRFTKGGRRYEKSFWSELDLAQDGGPEVTLSPGSKRRRDKKGPLNGPWSENTLGWFAAGYGPFRRLYGASPDAQRLMSGPSRVARFATMFKEDATLGECEIWLKDLNHKKLEKKPKETRILEQVIDLLNRDFLRNGIRIEKVDSEGLWLVDSKGTTLSLADMSEGYRASLAMLVDIARHVVSVYGEEELISGPEGHMAVQHPGVVLIDEIDSHLHPEWQREIGFWLKRHFPRVQFIVTTHSSFICQAADPRGLFHLPAPGRDEDPFQLSDEDYNEVIRGKPDAILRGPAFEMRHTRSPAAVDALKKLAALHAKKKAVGRLTESEAREEGQLSLFVDPA